MKLTNSEATLLAKEIRQRIQKKISPKVSPETLKKIKVYKEKWDVLKKAEQAASSALEEHEAAWDDLGLPNSVYASDSQARISQKIKEDQIPSIFEIRDTLTLNALFKKDEDMETFIENVTKKFIKKETANV